MTAEVVAASPRANLFRRLWPVLKWVLFALVLLFVGRKAWQLWFEGDVGSVQIHWPWLLAACGLYVVGWLPSVLFWHRLIHGLRGTSSLLDVAQAFFAGHLGKYVPGKASVLLIRAGLLANRGCRPGVAALTSTYETLVCMGVGAAVGLTLAPIVWPHRVIKGLPSFLAPAFEHPLAFGLSVVVVSIVLVPVIAKLLGLIARKLTPQQSNPKRERGLSHSLRARLLQSQALALSQRHQTQHKLKRLFGPPWLSFNSTLRFLPGYPKRRRH